MLGEAIKKRREDLEMTQDELAAMVEGIKSRQSVQKWEAGTVPRGKLWESIEKSLQVTAGWISRNITQLPDDNEDQPNTETMTKTEAFFWELYKEHGDEKLLKEQIKILLDREEESESLKKTSGDIAQNG